MPVHEIHYKPWEGALRPPIMRIAAIPKFTLMTVMSKWLSVVLFAGGVLPVVIYSGFVLVVTNPIVREIINIRNIPDVAVSTLFHRLILFQTLFAMLGSLFASPSMISSERANRALPLLYSRPISRLGYIGGKFAGLFAVLSLLTWVQTIVIGTIMYFLYPDTHAFHVNFWNSTFLMIIAAAFIGLLIAISTSLVALACSAATKNTRFSAVLLFVLLAGSSFFTNFIQEVGWEHFPNFGLREIFYWLGENWIARPAEHEFGTFSLLFAVVLWIAAAVGYMMWRLRPVDVYGD